MVNDYEKKRAKRNLNPHAEAVYAMGFWGETYAAQGGGSMDFWDKLSPSQKRFCTEQVKKIKSAPSKFAKGRVSE